VQCEHELGPGPGERRISWNGIGVGRIGGDIERRFGRNRWKRRNRRNVRVHE
jgi:hypothetical protein